MCGCVWVGVRVWVFVLACMCELERRREKICAWKTHRMGLRVKKREKSEIKQKRTRRNGTESFPEVRGESEGV